MILNRRRSGSQRGYAPIKLELQNTNTAGQGGDNAIVLYRAEVDTYYSLIIETEAEWRELLSAVQKAGHHV